MNYLQTYFPEFFNDSFVSSPKIRETNYYLKETDSNFIVDVDLPGIEKKDLKVDVKNNILSISGERKTANSSMSYQRSWSLPDNVDPAKIKANLHKGVLTVVIPKKELTPAISSSIEISEHESFNP